jgi:competence protein ComEA
VPARRLAPLILALAALLPAAARVAGLGAPEARGCQPEGRGTAPRHWVGCAADPGPRRDLDGKERLVLGLPLDLNRADAGELALVPGLSPRLAAALVADRAARGPFESVEEMERVKGIGPGRLGKARPYLEAPRARELGPFRAGDRGEAPR